MLKQIAWRYTSGRVNREAWMFWVAEKRDAQGMQGWTLHQKARSLNHLIPCGIGVVWAISWGSEHEEVSGPSGAPMDQDLAAGRYQIELE
jgi:hypothetical protein